MTPRRAVWLGHRSASLPALGILGIACLAGWVITDRIAGALLGFVAGVLPAWLYWSYAIPRWRDWLEDQGMTEESVYRLAVGTGLVFPRGSSLEATEFRRRDGSRGWRSSAGSGPQ